MATRGVIYMTVDEGTAQAVDHLVDRLQLPKENVVKMGVSALYLMMDREPQMFARLYEEVKREVHTQIERVLV